MHLGKVRAVEGKGGRVNDPLYQPVSTVPLPGGNSKVSLSARPNIGA